MRLMCRFFATVVVLSVLVSRGAGEEVQPDQVTVVRLLALAEDDRASLEQREAAIRQLARLNAVESVPILIGLVEHPKLQPTVISSLVSMRAPELDGLLRDHLQKASQPLAKWIEMVGLRRDEQAVEILAERLSDGDETIVRAAAMALAEIATDNAGQRLDRAFRLGVSPRVYVIADGYLHYARRLAETDRVRARQVMDLVAEAYLPGDYRIKALRCSIELDDEVSRELLKSLLHSSDDAEFQLAVDKAACVSKEAVPTWLQEELSRLDPQRRKTLEGRLPPAASPAGP